MSTAEFIADLDLEGKAAQKAAQQKESEEILKLKATVEDLNARLNELKDRIRSRDELADQHAETIHKLRVELYDYQTSAERSEKKRLAAQKKQKQRHPKKATKGKHHAHKHKAKHPSAIEQAEAALLEVEAKEQKRHETKQAGMTAEDDEQQSERTMQGEQRDEGGIPDGGEDDDEALGVIDYEAVAQRFPNMKISEVVEFETRFKEADEDNSGLIDQNELHVVLAKTSIDQALADEIARKYDLDFTVGVDFLDCLLVYTELSDKVSRPASVRGQTGTTSPSNTTAAQAPSNAKSTTCVVM
eukprot:m.179459 g.179459  ORF g.179459 m.179459 type:complete len:301 (+) comp14641_c1_seq4:110-1012(+)